MNIKHSFAFLSCCLLLGHTAHAQNLKIDPDHSFVVFKASHLGISTTIGQIPHISGTIEYQDSDPTQCSVEAQVNIKSVNTHHAERDKHLKGKDFFNVSQFPKAYFASSRCEGGPDQGIMYGTLEFLGVKKPVEIEVEKVGEGKDPWGGYRVGFKGVMKIDRTDFGMNYNLGPNTNKVEIKLFIEGIKT